MLEVLERCFADQLETPQWQERLRAVLPSYGQDPATDGSVLAGMRRRSDARLGLEGAGG